MYPLYELKKVANSGEINVPADCEVGVIFAMKKHRKSRFSLSR